MKEDYQKFTAKGASLVVVAPHTPDKVLEYWEKEKLPMLGVPDEGGKLAALYGQEWKLLKLGRMPAIFVVDQRGELVFVHFGKNMADIPNNDSMLEVLDGLND